MAAGVKSVRQLVLEAIAKVLQAIDPDNPPLNKDAFFYKFSSVVHGPLNEHSNIKLLMAGVVPSVEVKVNQFPWKDIRLRVAIEWRFTTNKGDDEPGLMAEKILSDIQRALALDTTLGGVAIDVVEQGSEIDLSTYADRSIYGVVFYEVRYRHAHDDPRNPDPTV